MTEEEYLRHYREVIARLERIESAANSKGHGLFYWWFFIIFTWLAAR